MALIAGAIAIGNTGASASTTLDQIFELDGNPQDANLAAAPDDWQSFLSPNSPKATGFVAASDVPVNDAKAPADTSYYTGGGSKDVNDINQWAWTTGDVAPDKDELLNAAAAGYKVDNGSGGKDLIVTFTADRFDNSGDSQIGFWFFGNDVVKNTTGGFDGKHKTGDILVLSDFSQGGTISTINVYEWVGGKSPLQHLTQGTGSVDCSDAAHNPYVCAIENHNDGTPSVWPFQSKAGTSNEYPHGTFLEGGINVTKLLGGTSTCFASFLAETRSSTSTTAQLKDFALGSFPVCAPRTELSVSVSPTGPYHAGDPVVFTYSDLNKGTGYLTNATVTDTACTTSVVAKTSGGFNVGDTNANGLFDVNETWQWTCSMGATATTHNPVADGVDPNFNSVHVTWCATPSSPPTGVYCSQTEKTTITLTLINPGTVLTISQSATIVHAGESVTWTYKEKNSSTDSDITNSPYPIAVTDDHCSTVTQTTTTFNGNTYNVGDVNHDGILNKGTTGAGEEWTFTCTETVSSSETHTATATGTDAGGANVTYFSGCANSATLVCDPHEQATANVSVIDPHTKVTLAASATVTYTFLEENTGDTPLSNVSVDTSGAGCTTPAAADLVTFNGNQYNSGDANHNNKLDVGEKWKFTCTGTALTWKTGDAAASQTNTATGHGTDTSDSGGGADVTYGSACTNSTTTVCDSNEQTSVTVTISS